ncbi:hypothetical protein [Arsenophonus sp.]|uniref:helix-turn-helix domain-containing protein n=1 Tax=Arsenophonus sp. TaxID=1872640 RepID=UPI0038794C2F
MTNKSSIGEKIRKIREAEGINRQKFSEMLDIPYGSLNNYETKNIQVTESVLTKITNHPMFKKYTLWLMNDSTAEEYGQIAPLSTTNKNNNLKITSSTFKIENGLLNTIEEEIDTRTINNIIMNMHPNDRSRLAKILSKEGFRFLLEFLDPNNQSLLNLPENKKRAALRLESMGDEQFREILSKIEGNTESPQEEINVFTKKTAE